MQEFKKADRTDLLTVLNAYEGRIDFERGRLAPALARLTAALANPAERSNMEHVIAANKGVARDMHYVNWATCVVFRPFPGFQRPLKIHL